MSDLGLAGDHPLDATQVRQFSLAVAKSTADRQSTGKDAIGSNEGILFLITILRLWHVFLSDLLRGGCGQPILHYGLSLVDVATCICDSLELARTGRLVVKRWSIFVQGCVEPIALGVPGTHNARLAAIVG